MASVEDNQGEDDDEGKENTGGDDDEGNDMMMI